MKKLEDEFYDLTLDGKRFFLFMAFNYLVGLDEDEIPDSLLDKLEKRMKTMKRQTDDESIDS